jgi:hypothetical protein
VHNYPPQSTLPIDSELRQAAKQMLSNGMSPSTVFKELVLQSQEASVTNVLTPTQLRKSKPYMKNKALPSSGAYPTSHLCTAMHPSRKSDFIPMFTSVSAHQKRCTS